MTLKICKLFDFLQTEFGYKLAKTEIANVNDVFFVEYYRENDFRTIRLERDRGYYEANISIGKSYYPLPLILKYLFPDEQFKLNYHGDFWLKRLAEFTKQYYEKIEYNVILLDEKKIDQFLQEHPVSLLEWN